MENNLDFESYQCREMYAHFGLAVYLAQTLERGIAILLTTVFSDPKIMTKTKYDELLDGYFQKTMGSLIKILKKNNIDLPEDLEIMLSDALTKRNFLIHNFFWERVDAVTIKGREKIILELHDIQNEFDDLDKLITKLCKDWGEIRGVTKSHYQRALDDLIQKGSAPD